MLAPVLAHLRKLRALEGAAAADPGYEVDHDHHESASYEAYKTAWRELGDLISALPRPDSWLDLDHWCDANDHYFGEVEYPGVHRTRMGWNPRGLSLRTLIVESILRRAQERLARPDDESLWTDRRVLDLLRKWADVELESEVLAEILALLPSAAPIVAGLKSGALVKAVDHRATKMAAFECQGMEVTAASGFVTMSVRFAESLPPGPGGGVPLWLHERDSETRLEPFWVDLARTKKDAPLSARLYRPQQARVELGPGVVRVHVPGTVWKELKVPPGTLLSVLVLQTDVRRLVGSAPAPGDPGEPEPGELEGLRTRCPRCGDPTPVTVEERCPACEVAELPWHRPLADEEATRLEVVRRAWAETCCPHCGSRRFNRRWHAARGLLADDFRCKGCKKGLIVRQGRVIGPDARERALAVPPPGRGWIKLLSDLDGGEGLRSLLPDHVTRLAKLASALRDLEVRPEWREWLLQICQAIEDYKGGYLVFDSYDREHVDDVVGPLVDAVREIRDALEQPKSAAPSRSRWLPRNPFRKRS